MAIAVSGPGLSAEMVVRRSDDFLLEAHLSVARGQTVALLGPNAAGKTTAMSAIAGLLPVDRGRIALGDTVLDSPDQGVFVPPEDRHIGIVFQQYLLFPHMTALANVSFGLTSRGVDAGEARRRSLDWLDRLGLRGAGERRPDDLSGGEAQRVALARALVVEPEMLLLDEPLSAIDVTNRTELRHVLREHLEMFEGPRLLITHDPAEAFLLADDIYIIEEGAITQHGTANEIRLGPRTRYAADLAGFNLLRGSARGGSITASGCELHVPDEGATGPVLVTIHPTAISVHAARPSGSPRNSWETTVDRVEQLGDRVRLRTGAPLPLTVEVTGAARAEMGLEPGTRVWVAIKATEIRVSPDGG